MLILSGVIICQNKSSNIINVINNIYTVVDELIILDGGSVDNTLAKIKEYSSVYDTANKIKVFKFKFNHNFGDQKNLAISCARGIWVLNIDTDEFLNDKLLRDIPKLIRQNETHVYAVPRKNYINNIQTEVYPDYQLRLFRSYCRFVYPVHEELVGFQIEKLKYLDDSYYIIHKKLLDEQTKQNDLYSKIKATSNFMCTDIEGLNING